MAINNDLLNGIISGLSNMPKKSEIDTPTHNIDLDATETESGLMSAADKKKLAALDTDLSNLKTTVDGTVNMILALTTTGISDMPTRLGPDGETMEYINEYDDIKADSINYDILKVDGSKLSTIKTGGYVTRCYHPVTSKHDGLMSVFDKTKLDSIEAGANNYTLPIATKNTLGGVKTTSGVIDPTGLTPVPIIDGVPYYKNTTDYVLPVASNTTFGGVKTTSTVISTAGLTPCPIIAGVPYYDNTNAKYVDYVATVGPSGCTYPTILEWANDVKGTGYAFITDPNYPSDGPVENEAFLEVHSDASNTRKVVIWRRFLNSTSATKYRFIVNGTWWNNNPWQDA